MPIYKCYYSCHTISFQLISMKLIWSIYMKHAQKYFLILQEHSHCDLYPSYWLHTNFKPTTHKSVFLCTYKLLIHFFWIYTCYTNTYQTFTVISGSHPGSQCGVQPVTSVPVREPAFWADGRCRGWGSRNYILCI